MEARTTRFDSQFPALVICDDQFTHSTQRFIQWDRRRVTSWADDTLDLIVILISQCVLFLAHRSDYTETNCKKWVEDMPSLLSRLRSRGISLPTSNASLSTAPVAPTSANSIEPPLTSPDHITPNISPVDRKIHPNLDSLLDDYSIQLDHDRDRDQIDASAEFGTRLNPSTLRRHSVDGGHPKTRPSLANTTTTPGTLDDADENIESTASRSGLIGELFTQDSALGDDPSRTRRILDHISYLASPSEWSTFGRHRDHKSPRLGSFGRQIPHVGTHSHDSNDFHIVTRRPRSNSKRKATGMNASSSEHSESFVTSKRSGSISRPSTAATAPITSREVASTTPSRKSSFKHPRGQDHEIRTTDCKYSSGSSSYRNNHAAMTPIRSLQNTSSSATHDILSDSPHTFGYPTPPDHASGFTFGPKSAYDSSPPPLPPFNHPELTAALRARSGTGSAANATVLSAKGLSPQDPDTIFESTHDRTFPRRSRFGSTNPAFASLPSFSLDKLRSRSKSSPSLPQVQQIFGPPSSPSASPPVPPPGSSRVKVHPRKCASGPRLRPRTNTLPVRRSSANWAKEATSRDQFSWPAQVSREILRLSFETYSAGSGRESRERGQHVISQGNPSSPHTNDLFLFESLGSPFLEGKLRCRA